jgi:hypothetical protein
MSPKTISAATALLLASWVGAQGQDSHDCQWLLRYGIHDTEETVVKRYTFEHLKWALGSSKAESIQDFKQEAPSLGLAVPGLFDIKFGNQDAKSHFRQWRDAFLGTTDHQLANDETLRMSVSRISPALMEAVKKCIEESSKRMLVAWVEPSRDDHTFTLHLRFTPPTEVDCIVDSVTFTCQPGRTLKPLLPEHTELIKKGARIPMGGLVVTFQREKTTDSVTLAVNTNRGKWSFSVPAYNPGDPTQLIQELLGRLSQLEAQVRELSSGLSATHHDVFVGTTLMPRVPQVYGSHRLNQIPESKEFKEHIVAVEPFPGEVVECWCSVVDDSVTQQRDTKDSNSFTKFEVRKVAGQSDHVELVTSTFDTQPRGVRVRVWAIFRPRAR